MDAAQTFALGGATGAAVIDSAIEHNASANTGAERRVEDVLVPDACSPNGFGQRGGVPVVIDARVKAEDALHFGG